MRRRKPVPHIETLERHPPDPLVWLAQFAAADRRGDTVSTGDLLRQLLGLHYWVGDVEGALVATLTVANGASYRLIRVDAEMAGRLRNEMLSHLPPPHSTPG
jgi:hypothetical protein